LKSWIQLKFRVLKRILVNVIIGTALLPFVSMVLPVGDTPVNQAKLDRVIVKIERLGAACTEQKLKGVLNYTARRYRRVGRFSVRIQTLKFVAGVNFPWCPGCIIDSEIWDCSDDVLLIVLVHEAHHDYYPWAGHYHFWGTIPARGYVGKTELDTLLETVQ